MTWKAGSIALLDVEIHFSILISRLDNAILKTHAVGWTFEDNRYFSPKVNTKADMYQKSNHFFGIHRTIIKFLKCLALNNLLI
jgi:hypothetical protein